LFIYALTHETQFMLFHLTRSHPNCVLIISCDIARLKINISCDVKNLTELNSAWHAHSLTHSIVSCSNFKWQWCTSYDWHRLVSIVFSCVVFIGIEFIEKILIVVKFLSLRCFSFHLPDLRIQISFIIKDFQPNGSERVEKPVVKTQCTKFVIENLIGSITLQVNQEKKFWLQSFFCSVGLLHRSFYESIERRWNEI
jgi:hypothetical protein